MPSLRRLRRSRPSLQKPTGSDLMTLILDQCVARVSSRLHGDSARGFSRHQCVDPGFYSPVTSPMLRTGVSTELPYLTSSWRIETASSKGSPLLGELDRMRSLMDDWDSCGASAPAPSVIADAYQWLEQMSLPDVDATLPDSIAPGVNGDIVFYWQRPGLLLEATIDRPGHVEWMERLNDRIRHFESDTDFFVVIGD